MKIFFMILLNGILLYILQLLLPCHEDITGICVLGGWKTFFIGGVILGFINGFIRPILNILTLPIRILTLGTFALVINGLLLALFQKTVTLLNLSNTSYEIHGFGQFVIAVAIFTIFNTLVSVFIK